MKQNEITKNQKREDNTMKKVNKATKKSKKIIRKKVVKLQKVVNNLTEDITDLRDKYFNLDQRFQNLMNKMNNFETQYSKLSNITKDMSGNMADLVNTTHEHDMKIEMLISDFEKITPAKSSAKVSLDNEDDDVSYSDDPLYHGKKFNNHYDPEDEEDNEILSSYKEGVNNLTKELVDQDMITETKYYLDLFNKLYESDMILKKCTIRNIDGILLEANHVDDNILNDLDLKQYYLAGDSHSEYPSMIFDDKPDDSYEIYGYFFTFRDDVLTYNRDHVDNLHKCRLLNNSRTRNIIIGDIIKSGNIKDNNSAKQNLIKYMIGLKNNSL